MRISAIIAVIKKELLSLLDNPASYVAFILYVFFWEFLFFRSALLVGESSLRTLFDTLPWVLLLFSSAITMGTFSQEKSDGTLELLLTHPLKISEVIVGKFLSSVLFILLSLLFSLPIAFAFSSFAPFDFGIYAGQVLGSLFLVASFVSLGMFISLLVGNEIAALLGSAAFSFFFLVLGSDLVTANAPIQLVPYFERLSILTHFSSMARGVIDTRDVWYFLSFILIFLALTYLQLLRLRCGNRRDMYWRYQIGTYLFIGIAIVSAVIGDRIPGRIDLTADSEYTISDATKKTIHSVPDIVTITFYASSRLPNELSPIVAQIRDILRDYQTLGNGKVSVIVKDPSLNPQVNSEATSLGIREVQFNVVGQEEFQLKTGFVGIAVSYGDQHEVIPFIQQTSDLEYQITSLIAKLTTKEKKQVAFLAGHGEKTLASDYTMLKGELDKQFDTQTVDLIEDSGGEIATNAAVLVVAGPSQVYPDVLKKQIQTFLSKGKSAFLLGDGYDISQQSPTANPSASNLSDIVDGYGIHLPKELVYDLRSNETVSMGQGSMNLLLPYPFWIRALSDTNNPITTRVNGVMFPWTGPVTVDDAVLKKNGYVMKQLLTTSQFAGIQTDAITLAPDKASFPSENLKQYVLALSLQGVQSGAPISGRLVVAGDSDFLTDQVLANAPQNLAFGVSALSWLANDSALTGIRIRAGQPQKLLFHSDLDPLVIKYGNLALAAVIPLGVFLLRVMRRRSLRHMSYNSVYGRKNS